METIWIVLRALVLAAIVIAVGELSKSSPRYAAVLLALPVITILGFVMSWLHYHDLEVISIFARETIALVIVALPLFLPLMYCKQLGLGFWQALGCGILLASLGIGAWLRFGAHA